MVSGDSPVLSQAKSWLDHYFTGDRPDPKQLPLAPEGSAFRQMVWQCLLDIPYGRTMTYGQLAQQVARGLNRPSMSARAVGNAATDLPDDCRGSTGSARQQENYNLCGNT